MLYFYFSCPGGHSSAVPCDVGKYNDKVGQTDEASCKVSNPVSNFVIYFLNGKDFFLTEIYVAHTSYKFYMSITSDTCQHLEALIFLFFS